MNRPILIYFEGLLKSCEIKVHMGDLVQSIHNSSDIFNNINIRAVKVIGK